MAASRAVGELLHRPVICVHDENEQEPQPIRKKPIISVNGRDIRPELPGGLQDRKTL